MFKCFKRKVYSRVRQVKLRSCIYLLLMTCLFLTNFVYLVDFLLTFRAHVIWNATLSEIRMEDAAFEEVVARNFMKIHSQNDGNGNNQKYLCNSGEGEDEHPHLANNVDGGSKKIKKLVTMFTTFKEGDSFFHHEFVHSLVIQNRKNFSRKDVNNVLFTSNCGSRLSQLAGDAGWDVAQVRRTNPSGAVYLKDMFRLAFEEYNSIFYAYSNGDILFDDSLIDTLKAIRSSFRSLSSNVLIIGQRTTLFFDEYGPQSFQYFKQERLKNISELSGSLFTDWGIDYFIFTKPNVNSFDWSALLDVVIGRIGYDNYVVAMAKAFGVRRIDATRTVLALHLNKPNVLESGRNNDDAYFNLDLIGSFDDSEGRVYKAEFITKKDSSRFYILQKD